LEDSTLTKPSFVKRFGSVVSFGLLTAFLLVSPLRGQVGTADVLGTVTDASGAVVPNAKVTIRSLDTSATRTTTTDERGDYVLNLLPNGHYSLRVEAGGFRTYLIADLALSTGDRARFDAKLPAGTVKETIEVTSNVAALQTDNSTVGSTVQEQTVQDLPLNGRNFIDVIQLQPGVSAGFSNGDARKDSPALSSGGTTPIDRRPTSTIIANGQSDALNNELIDGFDNNERYMGLIALRPSLDGIAEISIDTNTYRAEYGRTAGAVVNVVTKSGTNHVHGSVYDYFGNDVFDARDYFATIGQKPEYRLNEFGGSIGGPIWKNKTFFFADVEEDRLIQGLTQVSSVPTAYERANPGDLSDAGGPDCLEPGQCPGFSLNALALKYFGLYPLPNLPGSTNNYSASPVKTQYGTTVDGRIDHHFSENDLFFARYAYNPVNTFIPGPFPKDAATGISPGSSSFFPGPSNTTSQNLQLDYVHIFNSRLILDLKAAFTRVKVASVPLNYGQNASAKLDIPNVYNPSYPTTNVLLTIGGPSFSWNQMGDAPTVPLFVTDNTFQYAGSVTLTRGAHNLKVGAGIIRRQVSAFDNGNGAGLFAFVGSPPYFDSRANFLAGNPTVEVRQNQLNSPEFLTWEPSLYVQDDWRATPKLTLNLGLRYDVFTPFTEAHGQYVNFDPSTLAAGVGPQNFILGTQQPAIGVGTDFKDFAPRVGFAYSPTFKTVVRGGFGLSFFPPDVGQSGFVGGNQPTSIVQNYNPPYSFSIFQLFPSFSDGPVAVAPESLSTYASNPNVTSLSTLAKNLHSSYVKQMNLFVERELGAGTLSIGYVGVLGQQLLRTINADQPDPPGAGNPAPSYVYATQLPNVNTIADSYNGGSSNYNAMQVVYKLHATKGLAINANYTWSHGLANNLFATVNSNPSIDYGNTFLDVRQRFAVSANYEFPFAKTTSGIEGVLLKGWHANGIVYWQTSTPFTPLVNGTLAPNGNAYINIPGVQIERPDYLGTPSSFHPSINEWIDVDAFTPQTVGTVGDEGVNQSFAPHDRRADLSLMKNFALQERWTLQFRAECLNISNTPNFAAPNATISAYVTGPNGYLVPAGPAQGNSFGTITQTSGNENARLFQFALKLLF
jgi:Carboxypeptidase regulatory-like domain/TonB dependent receptor